MALPCLMIHRVWRWRAYSRLPGRNLPPLNRKVREIWGSLYKLLYPYSKLLSFFELILYTLVDKWKVAGINYTRLRNPPSTPSVCCATSISSLILSSFFFLHIHRHSTHSILQHINIVTSSHIHTRTKGQVAVACFSKESTGKPTIRSCELAVLSPSSIHSSQSFFEKKTPITDESFIDFILLFFGRIHNL